ncbi:MAG: acyl-CoA desaturase, partial [Rhodococcus sp.]|nr:acyl-CoA desaturase [Rhodococcus sp. (in: high G+C Gram-positive bacteria)]
MFGISLPFLPMPSFLSGGSRKDSTSEPAHTPQPRVLTAEQVEELGRELDAIRDRITADLGSADREYLYNIIKAQRGLEVAGRGLLFLGFFPPAWIAGVGALGVSKILDNMEIGHNVMHGQYDWMREPEVNSREFEWDTVC